MAEIISGTEMRTAILEELRGEVEAIRKKHGTVPGLVTILVGSNPASISYVTLKVKTALSLGFHEIQDNQPEDISEAALLELIEKYNRDPSIHGILVQLPLPKHIDENKVIYAIDPDKDVDGFHPVNIGRMVIGGDAVRFLPCTPAGIQEMLVRAGVETAGAEVVVVGRSNIVGKPIAIMLGQKGPGANATVTMVHTRTKDLAEHCRRADILIVAAGDARVDNKKYKEHFGLKAKMLAHDDVPEYIGHAVGGVCPFAVKDGVKVYLDESLKRFETVFPAAGSANSAIELTIPELEKYSKFDGWVDVCKDWRTNAEG